MHPVDLRMHTVTSTHIYSTLGGYITQAEQKGIELLVITDHGPDMEDAPHHWHFINVRIWPRMADGVEILCGIEINIKNVDGEIDCNDKVFDSPDLIIAGFHEPVFTPHDKATSTQTMITTIASGSVHMISHPGNPKYEIDAKTAAGAAARHQATLKTNDSSFLHSHKGSEDNCRAIAATVRDAGGWVTLGSDSRTALTMKEFEECLKILDAVDFPPERILDVSPRHLLNFLESRGMAPIVEFADL